MQEKCILIIGEQTSQAEVFNKLLQKCKLDIIKALIITTKKNDNHVEIKRSIENKTYKRFYASGPYQKENIAAIINDIPNATIAFDNETKLLIPANSRRRYLNISVKDAVEDYVSSIYTQKQRLENINTGSDEENE